MSDSYALLLDAAIDHVQSLKKRGTKFLSVSPQILGEFQQTPRVAGATAQKTPQATPVANVVGRVPSPGVSPAPSGTPFAKPMSLEEPVDNRRYSRLPVGATSPAPASTLPPAAVLVPQIAPLTAAQRAEKEAAMQALTARTKACAQCPNLAASRKNVVFGTGDIHSPLMFIGEAPGADEDTQGEPFVGPAGQLLTKIIAAMGFGRQSVYIANILKCRPDTPGQLTGNRKPTPAEMQTCLPFLIEQIDLIRPQVIVALGTTAIEGLLGSTQGVSRLRGHFQSYRGIPLMPTFHPSYLLHNQAITEKRKVWEDMLQVMEKLAMPISEKQRGYFLK